MDHSADVINGKPLDKLILDLASNDKNRRDEAGVSIFLFTLGLSSFEEYERRGDMKDPELWPFPKPEAQKALSRAVSAVFSRKDFAVSNTVKALVNHSLQLQQRFVEAFWNSKVEEILQDRYQTAVTQAVQSVLSGIGPGAVEAIPILIEMLQVNTEESGNVPVILAALAIGSMGKEGAPALEALFNRCLDFSSGPVHEVMQRIVSESTEALEKMIEWTSANEATHRSLSLSILDKVGLQVPNLRDIGLKALGDSDENVRKQGGIILRRHFANEPDAVAALERARTKNSKALGAPLLIPENPWVRDNKSLAEWLIILVSDDTAAVAIAFDRLMSMYYGLNDVEGDYSDQAWIAVAPKEFAHEVTRTFNTPGFPATRVLKRLIVLLKEIDCEISVPGKLVSLTPEETAQFSIFNMRRNLLCNIIVNAAPVGAEIRDDLVSLLKVDSNKEYDSLSRVGAEALAKMGAEAIPAFWPLLKKAAKKHGQQWPNPWENALVTLVELEPTLIKQLADLLEKPADPALRPVAASVLGRLGPRALPALDAAIRYADSGGDAAERTVVAVFAAVAGISDAARARLNKLVLHPDDDTRACALSSLRDSPDIPEAVRLLEEGLKDNEAFVRWSALCTLCDLKISDTEKVRYCISMLDDEEGFDHWVPAEEAMQRLVSLGAAAAPAIPELLSGPDGVCDSLIAILENVSTDDARPALPRLKAHLTELLLSDPFLEYVPTRRVQALVTKLTR